MTSGIDRPCRPLSFAHHPPPPGKRPAMKSFVVLFFIAAALHFFAHVPMLVAAVGAVLLWIVWKLKYVILAFLGLEMMFGGDNDN
jgi:hypothetical protein